MSVLTIAPTSCESRRFLNSITADDAIPQVSILLVEDNPLDRHLTAHHLRQGMAGEHRLHTAACLSEAVGFVERERLDLILLDLDPDLPLVPALPGELNQALLNIVVNAADAVQEALGPESKAKGEIAISSQQCDNYVEVRI